MNQQGGTAGGVSVQTSAERTMEEGKSAPVGSQHWLKVTVPVGGEGYAERSETYTTQKVPAPIGRAVKVGLLQIILIKVFATV